MYRISKVVANPTIDFAAEELKKYLRMMMPRCGEVPISYEPEAKDGFRQPLPWPILMFLFKSRTRPNMKPAWASYAVPCSLAWIFPLWVWKIQKKSQ